jgi:hypothetical protein
VRLIMEPKSLFEYVAAPARVFMTIVLLLIALAIVQVMIVWIVQELPRRPREPAKTEAKEPTEEAKRLARIRYSAKNYLPDGTIHLVENPGRRYYSEWEDSDKQVVYDANDNLLWRGRAQDNPYEYISWAVDDRSGTFQAGDMWRMRQISPNMSRKLQVPVRSKEKTVEIWEYIVGRDCFVGYKAGGGKLGYIGADGFADSKSQAWPFGRFGSFIAWCPRDSHSPTLLWQTSRNIYQIDFEKRQVELIFQSKADIVGLQICTWGLFRAGGVEQLEGYRPLLHCRTKDDRDHLIMRDPPGIVTVDTPKSWNKWLSNHTRYAAADWGIFLERQWVDAEVPPKNFASSKDGQKWWRDYRAKPKKHWAELYKVDDQGGLDLLNKYGWTVPGESPADLAVATRLAYTWQKTRGCVSQFSPPLYDLLWHIPGVRMWRPDYRRHQNEILRESLLLIEQLRPGAGVWNFVIGALMVGFAAWHGWPRRTSRATLIFWLVFVWLFNLAGLLTYLALNHTTVIKCPVCGKRRGLAQACCVRCGAELRAPQPGKLDLIFDPPPGLTS